MPDFPDASSNNPADTWAEPKPPTDLQKSTTGPVARQGNYVYYMVQIPWNFAMQQGAAQGHEIATYVQEWANKLSAQGWEFYRIDTMGMTYTAGCLASLFGAQNQHVNYSIMTFRKPAQS